ncbi:receptor protein-tyrosine kinase [[Luteovulum] sphaeroides subsp. megalophilum]|nr:receptor protein-tyrosine kinase [[Luteovulum] sphaeroides subsp. megalophilum]
MSQAQKVALALRSQPTPIPLPVPAPAQEEWLDVQALFRIIRRRLPVAALVFVGLMALLTGPILDMKRSFTAQARVLMRDPPSAGLGAVDGAEQKPLNLSTEIERFVSRDISAEVIREVGLDKLPEFNAALREPSLSRQAINAVRSWFDADPPVRATRRDDLRLVIPAYMARLTVFQKGNSDVVNIGFSSEDASIAAAVPNAVIRTYLKARERQHQGELEANLRWLAVRIEEQSQRLNAALEAVATRRNQPDLSSPSALGIDTAIASLSERRIAIRHDIGAAERSLEDLKADGVVVGQSGDSGPEAKPQLGIQLEAARAELERLQTQFGENHSKVRDVRERIAEIESQMRFEVSSEILALTRRISSLKAEEAANLEELERARDTLARQKEAQAELARLENEASQEQLALAAALQQQRLLLSSSRQNVTEVSVLTPASVPLNADGRGKAFYLVAAMIGSAIAAVTAVFALEILDTKVRSAEHLRRIRRVVPTGIVPQLPRTRGAPTGPLGWWQPESVFADAVRAVVISLSHARRQHLGNILVSSALPGEGKTTVAAALAAEMAASGQKVLLVDADLRQGNMHRLFGLEPGFGLSDYLRGAQPLSEVIRHEVAPGIDLLPCGSQLGAARLDRQKMMALLQMARDAGQIVILDTPPALATVDTASLADLVETALLVVEWGRTDPDAVEAAVQRLTLGREGDVFAVINRVNLQRQALYGFRDGGPLARTLSSFHRGAARAR